MRLSNILFLGIYYQVFGIASSRHHHHHRRHHHHYNRSNLCVPGTIRTNGCYACECKDDNVERCSFGLNENTPRTPLILKNQGDPEWLYPNQYDVVHILKNKHIKLTCLDGRFKKLHVKTVVAKCLDNGMVQVRGQRKMQLSDLECERFPSSTLLRTNRTCFSNHTEYEVGFQLSKKFLKTLSLCFDETEKRALYSWNQSPKLHTGHQKNVKRPQFVSDNVYDFDVNKAYTRKEQLKTFGELLNSKALARKYIQEGSGLYYLARGHLTPKADFVYGSEQAASFHYTNVAPQWQIINEGNWNRVETNARKLMLEYPDRYDVLTGTYGVATLPDINNEQQELYLHVDNSGRKLPVPKLFWKTIYDKEDNEGVTILSVNNPYLDDIPNDYIICKDICTRINWFEVDTNKKDRGYIYCCDMKEFFSATGYENIFQPDEVSQEESTQDTEEEVDEEEVDGTERESKPEGTDYESVVIESSETQDYDYDYVYDEDEDFKSFGWYGFLLPIRHYLSRVLSKCRNLFTLT